MAGGLTPRQLRELRDEHGSLEAAIEARPDVADEIRAVQRFSDQARRTGENIQRAFEALRPQLMAVPESRPRIDAAAIAEYQIEMRAQAHERALRRVNSTKGDPGRPDKTMSSKTLLKILELSLKRARSGTEEPSLRAIANRTERDAELDYVPRQRVTPIADWVAANQSRAERYLERSEIPPIFRAIVSD
jgi:hypothetical protein